ncbi:DUF937 domain-containing protein [Tenacibaculum sp. SG-28]|uniref:DUF937 domain-containing protein n=1 Tax=Tenacibaculum sp. SG-28 TaxID=754426 RepID=UPI000CF491E0|nr:DUF937 domain-containing protein [Tenacibaculum sp. SG-28]PQJ23309.1 hypothetical protein BSU00_03670 [Tenacibaculum sp. SG-28]
MAGILDLLTSNMGKSIISGVAGSTGQSTDITNNVLTMAMPVLTKAMQRNAASPSGAESLMGALSNKHNGGILDNLGDLFEGGVNEEVLQDGGKILNHVLGSKQQGVEQIIGQKAGIDAGSVTTILQTAAPLLMGMLGKQTRDQGISNSGDLTNMLGGLLGGNSTQNEQNFLDQILDADGDGSVIDDVAGMVLGGSQKGASGGLLGGLLGGLFGKK